MKAVSMNIAKKLCKNYFDLLPIMKDHANAKPMMANDDIASDFGSLLTGSSEDDDDSRMSLLLM
jgi:hypothetical protein